MGHMGYGYGSEWHLLRYRGRHSRELNRRIEALPSLRELGAKVLHWLDCPFNAGHWTLDRDITGMEFLPDGPVKDAWTQWWPPNCHNWDAVGELSVPAKGEREWLLVEAKSHTGEVRGPGCQAKENGGLPKIRMRLNGTRRWLLGQQELGAEDVKCDNETIGSWVGPYYQLVNRLAAMRFMEIHQVRARLLLIYFCGDQCAAAGSRCPTTETEWKPTLNRMYTELGLLSGLGPLDHRVHTLFLPVCRNGKTHKLRREYNWPSPRPPETSSAFS